MFCIWLFCLLVCLCTTCVPGSTEATEGIRSSGAGATGGCLLPRGSWDPNAGPQDEHQVLLTTEPSPLCPSPTLALLGANLALAI